MHTFAVTGAIILANSLLIYDPVLKVNFKNHGLSKFINVIVSTF